MAKEKSKPEEVDQHGLTPEQFEDWELSELSIESYKKLKNIK